MADEGGGLRLEVILAGVLVLVLLTSGILIVVASFGKETVYSAYVTGGDQPRAQVSDARDTLEGYHLGNTMSTPMLVNDWLEPHRTMLLVVSPERPFDNSEAQAIHDFVTEKGGKVIIASDSTHANAVANLFGVNFYDAPLVDPQRYYDVENSDGDTIQSRYNVWSFASVTTDVDNLSASAAIRGCDVEITGSAPTWDDSQPEQANGCQMPLMFRQPTGMQAFPQPEDNPDDDAFPGSACDGSATECQRIVSRLSMASPSSIIDRKGNGDTNDVENPAPGDLSMVIRIDYPGIPVLDKTTDDETGFIDVTGSIVFIADDEVFSNALWSLEAAEAGGMDGRCAYPERPCWTQQLGSGERDWNGNGVYVATLIYDMMETDNEELAASVARNLDEFHVVFDESRHVTGVLTAPFTETMSTIVLLTSDAWLKWLILLNLVSMLFIAIMVVPQKENWRHVFDLTRFRERPGGVDPKSYQQRVRDSLFTKVRLQADLTREELAVRPPTEVQKMIADPRLIELAYSQKEYSPEELQELLRLIRRWGK